MTTYTYQKATLVLEDGGESTVWVSLNAADNTGIETFQWETEAIRSAGKRNAAAIHPKDDDLYAPSGIHSE